MRFATGQVVAEYVYQLGQQQPCQPSVLAVTMNKPRRLAGLNSSYEDYTGLGPAWQTAHISDHGLSVAVGPGVGVGVPSLGNLGRTHG